MATVQQQGSRAGLITWLVIFVILFVTMTILFFYQNSLRQKSEQSNRETTQRYEPVISPETMTQGPYTEATGLRGTTGKTAFEVIVDQRDKAVAKIGGGPGVDKALSTAADAENVAQTNTGLTNLKGSPLTSIIKSLADRIIELNGEKESAATALAASEGKNKTFVDAQEALIKEKDAKITELTTKLDAAVAEVKANEETLTKRNETVQTSADAAIAQVSAGLKTSQATTAAKTAEVAKLTKAVDQYNRRLQALRVNTNEAIVQVPDGRIIRLPGNDVVYVDLGIGDQIAPGMTFEVYDKNTGIPALGDGLREGDLPKGKASIEIIRPGPGSSEARIIRKTAGESVVEGDYIASIVYDPKVKYNFVVYGDFDLNHDGRASSGEGEVIKRLINQWGARTQDAVNIDTDFVVMGKEPTIPEVKADDKENPQVLQMIQEAQAKIDAYNKVRDGAIDLRIPIMNQNRFLYFVGFYNQAAR